MLVVADTLDGDAMPSDVLNVFKQTLQILSRTLRSQLLADMPLPQVVQSHEIYSRAPNQLRYELKKILDSLTCFSG